MIPGVDLIQLVKVIGIFGLTAMIFAESGLLIGFFFPGDTVIFTAGFLVHAGLLPVNITALALILFAAAVAGDSVGYTFGRRVGRRLFERPNSRLFKQAHLRRAEAFYKKHGGKAIVIARFIPAVRTFAPIVAGASNMTYRSFVTYNLLGGFLWVTINAYLGFFLGAWFESIGISIDHVLLPLVFVILFLSLLPGIIPLVKNPQQRQAFWQGAKKQIVVIFKRK